jgi:hypothetical protein
MLEWLKYRHGRARAQLSTAAGQVRSQVRSCGICDGQSGTGANFLRVLRFPMAILIPPTAPHSSSIIRGWYNRPNSDRSTKWTQSHPTSRNKKNTDNNFGNNYNLRNVFPWLIKTRCSCSLAGVYSWRCPSIIYIFAESWHRMSRQ